MFTGILPSGGTSQICLYIPAEREVLSCYTSPDTNTASIDVHGLFISISFAIVLGAMEHSGGHSGGHFMLV